MVTALKVCGLTRPPDVEICAGAGVDAIGLNLWPKSRRAVDVATAKALCDLAGSRMQKVGVFVDRTPSQVKALASELRLDAIQPHGDGSAAAFAATGVPWVWVIRGTPELDTLAVPKPLPAWVLLDAVVPGYGGAGKTTDWAWAAKAVRHLAPLPVWLAGGITPDNAAKAVGDVAPAGLDVASGVEAPGAPGCKDPARVEALMRALGR